MSEGFEKETSTSLRSQHCGNCLPHLARHHTLSLLKLITCLQSPGVAAGHSCARHWGTDPLSDASVFSKVWLESQESVLLRLGGWGGGNNSFTKASLPHSSQ